MRNKHRIWFTFNGRSCVEMDTWLKAAPAFVRPVWRGDALTAIGRSGDIFATDNAYDAYELKIKIVTRLRNIERVMDWLTGTGLLSFSWRLNRACLARIVRQSTWNFIGGLSASTDDAYVEAEITFTCQPWYYMQPWPNPITIETSGEEIYNPGTVPSFPTVTLLGSGSFSVTIANQTIYFQNLTNGIIVDSELGDAYSLDSQTNMNNNVFGELWEIPTGSSIVSWDVEQGSSLTSISILPKWRFRA